jgi:hypothetical protein
VDNPRIDERKEGNRVPDPVYVGPVPCFERSEESGGIELFEVPALEVTRTPIVRSKLRVCERW